jgi:hypothetical protein
LGLVEVATVLPALVLALALASALVLVEVVEGGIPAWGQAWAVPPGAALPEAEAVALQEAPLLEAEEMESPLLEAEEMESPEAVASVAPRPEEVE